MRWTVTSPYFESVNDQWISDAAPSDRHTFNLVPRVGAERDWHRSGAARAGVGEWVNRTRQSRMAFGDGDAGIITVFPQLAAAAGMWKVLHRSSQPLVAWLFNTEGLNTPLRCGLARVPLGRVDRFVVHSTAEVYGYADLLRLPEDRFEYVPLQYGGTIETAAPEGCDEPYVFATGSGYRDYATLFDAAEQLGLPTIVVASQRSLDGLRVPPNVTIRTGLDRSEIRRLIRHARVNVVPLTDRALTAGLVTIVETFRHGRSVVTTERPGLDDYCTEGKTALCADLFDATSMARCIELMWSDGELRESLDRNAENFAEDNCTDTAAARHMFRILDSVSR
jgi:glycosyltransferase involved in cell wall biosynthesis